MNFRRTVAVIGGLHLLIFLCFLWWQQSSFEALPPPAAALRPSAGVSSLPSHPQLTPGRNPDASPERGLADLLNTPGGTIRADLEIVSQLMEAYRTNFPTQGNPVGENVDITAALTGRNPARTALIAKNHRAINSHGELCDRWGTPFFFHQLSGSAMEIRSAGQDLKLWTSDDVAMTP